MEKEYLVFGGILFGILLLQRHNQRCKNNAIRQLETPCQYMDSCEMSGNWW